MTSDSSQVGDGDRPAESKEAKREIKRRMKSITHRFSDRFSDEQIDQIRGRVARSITLGANLEKVDLPNGTSPDFDPRAMSNG